MSGDPVQAVKAIINPVAAVNSAVGGAVAGEPGRATLDPFGTAAQKGVEAIAAANAAAQKGPKSAGAAPDAPTAENSAPATNAAAAVERKRAQRGRAATLLTGAGGISTAASTTGRTLLGS